MSPVAVRERLVAAAPPRVAAARPVSKDEFVGAMGRAVTGVWILSTDGPRGRVGLTVSAVSSVSAEPPLVLVCVNRKSQARDAVLESGVFALSLLADEQASLADVFAGRPAEGEPFDFERAEWTTAITGAPLLVHGAASFDCVLTSSVEAGTHTIFIGSVVSTARADHAPLAYTDRRYARAVVLGQ